MFLDWYTLITQNILSLDTEKLAERSFQHWGGRVGGGRVPHWKNRGSLHPPLVPTPMNFLKHFTDWLGVSTVDLCGRKKRDPGEILRLCVSPKVGGVNTPSAPPPWQVGVRNPPCPPPIPTPMLNGSICQSVHHCSASPKRWSHGRCLSDKLTLETLVLVTSNKASFLKMAKRQVRIQQPCPSTVEPW